MKKTILIALMAALTLGVNAGDWGKAPIGKAPIEDCIDIGGEISVGYMTDYYYHGIAIAEDSVWADVNYTFDGLAVPVTVGVWYLNGIHSNTAGPFFDQLDLYASADLGTFAGFDVSLGYTHHFYPEIGGVGFSGLGSNGEIGLEVRRSLGFVDFVAETNYLLDILGAGGSGWYHQAGLEKSIGLTDNISLVLAGAVGYLDVQSGHGWSHYNLTASLPIQLNCRTTLTPYVGYFDALLSNFAQNGADGNVHAGVSVSVTF